MPLSNLIEKTLEDAVTYVLADNTVEVDVSGCDTLAINSEITDVGGHGCSFGPSAVNFVTNIITKANHTLTNHAIVQFSINGAGTLPSGLQDGVDYRVLVLSSSTFQVLTTELVLVSLGNAGTGTSSEFNVEESALTNGVLYLGKSIDGINWEYDGGTAISGTVHYFKEVIDPAWRFYQLDYTFDSGVIRVTSKILGKGVI